MTPKLKSSTLWLLLAFPLVLAAETPRTSIDALRRKDSLTPVAFTGIRLIFAELPQKEISPSVTDIDLWATSQVAVDGYKSMVYTFRVDCGSKEYALIGVGGFQSAFWQGEPTVHNYANRTPLWRPLKDACPVLQNVCSADISQKLAFYGPETSSSCP